MRWAGWIALSFLSVLTCASARGSAPANAKETKAMSVVYERSGGFTGMRESLSVEGPSLKISKRGKQVVARELTGAEQERLTGLLAPVAGKDAPTPAEPHASDTFRVTLMIDGKSRVDVRTLAVHAPAVGAPWDELLHALDALLTQELRAAHPEQPKILGPEEL